ncbi:hypothetical protein [Streptomyces albireticuli]|uniref:hypothetical protein n=1 Tax=Streptomyces albireticuli TaxID=1940 RepID=UPI001180B2D4|nr:hypothetical protein [Streptomyces albireticuli]MCD9140561.1 hypothetical protein [Streptomyces albireticuli]MCD9161477.1 hypothetical protein [Streptomyces albireticuli]MCD9192953.1 hypothetical protein [Streptomyces albireticuli]
MAATLLLPPGAALAVCVGAFGAGRAGAKARTARPLILLAHGVPGLLDIADSGRCGYSVRPGRGGLVPRSGEARVAHRTAGGESAVTADDSAAAAPLDAPVARDHAAVRADHRENDPTGQGG